MEEEEFVLKEHCATTDEVKAQWRDYILTFQKVLDGVYNDSPTFIIDVLQTSRYSKGKDWAFDTHDLHLAHTFREEAAMVDEGQRRWPIPIDVVEKDVKDTYLGESLSWRTAAHNAFERLQHIAGYMIMRHQMRPFTLREIHSKRGRANGGMAHSFHKHKVLKQLVQGRLLDLQDVFQAALSHIEAIYSAITSVSERCLVGSELSRPPFVWLVRGCDLRRNASQFALKH